MQFYKQEFWGFKLNERSNNPEKNNNMWNRTELQYILRVVQAT